MKMMATLGASSMPRTATHKAPNAEGHGEVTEELSMKGSCKRGEETVRPAENPETWTPTKSTKG